VEHGCTVIKSIALNLRHNLAVEYPRGIILQPVQHSLHPTKWIVGADAGKLSA